MARITEFGYTADGQRVDKITLRAGDLTAAILTWGAVLQSVRLDRVAHDLTLGSDRLADYEGAFVYNGSLIAPMVNRLTNAVAPLGDRQLRFEVNFANKHVLHSGSAGTQTKVWQVLQASDTVAVLGLDLPDGEGGFPGNRHVEARFDMAAPASLRLSITVTSDAETLWNATNHSYWTLDDGADFTGQTLTIAADHYLPTTEDFIPTGEIRAVDGMFDFRKGRAISPREPFLDNCFCISRTQEPLREVMALQGRSGLRMTVATTEPGLQIYDCRHDGFRALAVEAQGWPDAANQTGFPSTVLGAGDQRVQTVEWRFEPH